MRLRSVLFLALLLLAVLAASPAWARPCCSECPNWPFLDPYNDPCARVCDFDCFAPQSLHFPKMADTVSAPDSSAATLEQIFATPEKAGENASAAVCQ